MQVIALSVPDADISSAHKPSMRVGRPRGSGRVAGRAAARRLRGPAIWRLGFVLLAACAGFAGAAPHPESAGGVPGEAAPMARKAPAVVAMRPSMDRVVGEAARERQWATHRSSLRRVVRWTACPPDAAPGTCARSRCVGSARAVASDCMGAASGGLRGMRAPARDAEQGPSRATADPARRVMR
ncbi:hypothetical protein ARC20_14365 [Stenotrophomonas panacihumi]|uniref:Uncharacterized protein n=1 Tax=Stenotrophomonas panacihumi TaxID=676599 RepID=A0A0R0A0L1_9GAMM|nr:hypothetical protein [Stenotrophomonas panacihumi]KRG38795.1 hypothetical protein ARC20_14365 [Stenotrophomonas panacihumi]PTN53271.1 hypothetical protein C9J98_16490 [Stenotrophomonas panacihumi]